MRGIALRSEENEEFIRECKAVSSFAIEGNVLDFTYDPEQIPAPEDVPEGIYFDLSEAPF